MSFFLTSTPCLREGETPPPFKWWGRTFVTCRYQGKLPSTERVIQIRLPIWGIGYSINDDSEKWGQRILMYRGHSGFSLQWYFA